MSCVNRLPASVLSKPVSVLSIQHCFHFKTFLVPVPTVKIRNNAYKSFMVVYSIRNVRQWLQYISGCGKSTIKVGESTLKVRRTYG